MNVKFYILLTVLLFCLPAKKAESRNAETETDTVRLRSKLDSLRIKIDSCRAVGDYSASDDYAFKGLEICYALNDTASSARFLFAVAKCYSVTLRSAEALTYMQKALPICQKNKDTILLGEIYYDIGAIYAETRVYDMAIDYFKKYLGIVKALGDTMAVVKTEATIALTKGDLYDVNNDTTSLLEALAKCEEIFPKIDKKEAPTAFMNFCINAPNLYIKAMEFSDDERAKFFLTKADEIYCAGLELAREVQLYQIYLFPTKITLFCAKRKFDDAKRYLDKFGRGSDIENFFYVTAACIYYKAVNDYRNYLKYSSEARIIEHRNFSSEMCAKYERSQSEAHYEERMAEYAKEAKERDTKFQIETDRAKLQNGWMSVIILIVLVIAVIKVIQFISSSRINKTLQKANEDINFRNLKLQELQDQILSQNEKIKTQNSLIEEQRNNLKDINEHLIGSIRYAQRIQKAAVPSKEMMDEIFAENFVYWQPRDIVSGDFYWAAKDGDRKYLITADCTGHGVPGALLSMLGISVISDSFATIKPETSAGEILDTVKTKFLESWVKSGGNIEDGIDMALIVVDSKNGTLQYAGAKRPLVMIRNNEATVMKPDKMCIGYNIKKLEKNFTNYVVETQSGDMFYAFSDGIPDQFGGEDGKAKFSQKKLLELLANIADFPASIQQTSVKANVINWMDYEGKKVNQLDDQLLIGIRV